MIVFIIYLCVVAFVEGENNSTRCSPRVLRASARTSNKACMLLFNYDPICEVNSSIVYCEYIGECLQFVNGQCSLYSILRASSTIGCKNNCCPLFQGQQNNVYGMLNCGNSSASDSKFGGNTPAADNQNGGQAEDPSVKNLVLFIIFIAGLVGLGLMVIILICRKCRQCMRNEPLRNLAIAPHLDTERHLSPIVRQNLQQKKWQRLQVGQLGLRMDSCSICLNAGPNATLDCVHKFHKQCIAEWLKRVFNCPLCKRSSLLKIQILCKHCYGHSYKINLSQLQASFESEDICSFCRQYDG